MQIQPRSLARAGVAALAVLTLSGCGPQRNEFAPACPNPAFVPALADLVRYRPNSSGQDVTDLVLQARMLKVDGTCKYGDKKTELATTVSITIDVQRGIAMPGRQDEVPVFVAVTDGGVVRDKQVYTVPVTFASNVDRVTLTSPPIDITLPIGPTKSGAAYGIITGFQLSPEELATNRHRLAR
jgi:hypothetical protein